MVVAVEFQPGVGVGVEYTDNATLAPDNKVDDLIAVGYVGANIFEDEGPLQYDVAAAFNKQHYTQDSYEDQRYLNFSAVADWEMIRERFNWFLSNYFTQRTVNTLDSNTPDNLQDTNAFNFGANILFPISSRQSFSLIPQFSQYYYEIQRTDNKQYMLIANWNYLMSRLTNIGLTFSSRKINYTEEDIFGNSIDDTVFTNAAIIINGQRLRSNYSINLGATNVERDNSEEDATGFSGYANWQASVSSRSSFESLLSTELTDTSRVSQSLTENPADVQITTDVVRNSFFNLAYLREDSSLRTRLWGEFRKLTYSDSPLDSEARSYGINMGYPVTQLLSSGAYIRYSRIKRIEIDLLDQYHIVGGNLRYNFSRNLHGTFDIKYRLKESTSVAQNYEEFSVFASLVYGFGDVRRPSRTGGF